MKKREKTGEVQAYYVSIPIAGTATITVEASSEEEAEKMAWEEIGKGVEPEVEWEYHEKIASGNVLHVSQNEVEVGLA